MHCNNHIRNQMARRRNHRNTSLTKFQMNAIIQQRRRRVANQGGQENERDYDESEVVVFLQLH